MNKYTWNNAYNFIMKLKNDYLTINDNILDTYSIKEMCKKLNRPEYNTFLSNVQLTVLGEYNLLKYDITNEDIYNNPNSIYREMRSLVINMATDEIVLCPFKKFFNIGEVPETSIDIIRKNILTGKTIEFTDKLDGSMQSARWYNEKVFMSGSKALDSEQSFRVEEGYKWITESPDYVNLIRDYPDYTFIFEYISSKDKHVVNYTNEQQGMYLIGIRDINTGYQFPYSKVFELANKYNIKTTTQEHFSLDELLKKVKKYSATEKEGWVLYIDGIQYKLKCDDYVNLHKIVMTNRAHNHIFESIKNGTFDDVLSKLPDEIKSDVMEVAKNVYNFKTDKFNKVMNIYNNIPHTTTDKEFALYVQANIDRTFHGFMYNLHKNRPIDIFKGVSYNDILSWMEQQSK